MQSELHKTSRRVFLKKSLATSLFATSGVFSSVLTCSQITNRRVLPEPGPMIPPVPAILLTVKGRKGDPDEISVVWTFVVNGSPPQIGASVGNEHIAGDLVKEYGEFVLNVPIVNMVKSFDIVDMNSSRVADKFVLSGLTRGKATQIHAPTVEEAPIQLECKVFNSIEVPPVRTMFLAEVVATTVLEDVCDEIGRLIVANVPFFGMTAGSGEFYTIGDLVGHIGQSVGRSDIKY